MRLNQRERLKGAAEPLAAFFCMPRNRAYPAEVPGVQGNNFVRLSVVGGAQDYSVCCGVTHARMSLYLYTEGNCKQHLLKNQYLRMPGAKGARPAVHLLLRK
jgi:hypothetical protein